tara:strand:+ start:1146 stop:1403 length:258 start_codon:yes stop_codon:yes gene_type:complete
MKTYRKSDMFLTGWGSHWQTAKIVEEAIVTENDLNINFDYETDDEHEQEILNKGKEFLNTCEIGDSYRWEVDFMSMQYCELRRLS